MDLYPQNKYKKTHKIVFDSDFFNLTYNIKENKLSINKTDDILYSKIPHDKSRKYLELTIIKYLQNPTSIRKAILKHEPIIKKYIAKAILKDDYKNYNNQNIVDLEYQKIFEDPFFEIQVGARILQHDDTGPLSASLPEKFLYYKNKETGIYQYIYQFAKFIINLTYELPVMISNNNILLIENSYGGKDCFINKNNIQFSEQTIEKNYLDYNKNYNLKTIISNFNAFDYSKPIIKSEIKDEILEINKNYKSHSLHPFELRNEYENCLNIENNNLINIVSDIHIGYEQKIPFVNKHFNILAGDIIDTKIYDKNIKGIWIIGNHEISTLVKSEWIEFKNKRWFELLLSNHDESWPYLPIGDHKIYDLIKKEMQKCLPNMHILNNESIIYQDVRYIGITVPVVFIKRKKEMQKHIYKTLKKLLEKNKKIPTVIISHAPSFNELSKLDSKSASYKKEYTCDETKIIELFEQYHIVAIIHGHHHIPASKGICEIKHLQIKIFMLFVLFIHN